MRREGVQPARTRPGPDAATATALANTMKSDGTFLDMLLGALARDDDSYGPAPRRPRAGFWRDLLVALRRDTPAFTGRRPTADR